MSTITTRSGKGSALTVAEMDNNLTALNTDKLELDDISVTTGSPSGAGALSYNNTTGVFTFQAADLTLLNFIASVDEDTTPQLGGNLDTNGNTIQTNVTNGNLNLAANGTGAIEVTGGSGVNLRSSAHIFTNVAATDIDITPTGQLSINSLAYFDAGIQEAVHLSTTTTGTYAPNPTDGSIHYVALSGNMTINGFSSAVAGQTVTLFFDGTGGAYTLTLGASVLSPGGSLALTSGGYDIVTITCIDDVTPVYVATAINNFQ